MTFADELDVRQEAFLDDFRTIDSQRLQQSLNQAHQEILRGTVLNDESPINSSIKRAEALLAIAHHFQALAVEEAFSAEAVRTPELRLNEHERVAHLLSMTQRLRDEAWGLLQPYLKSTIQPISVTKGGCR